MIHSTAPLDWVAHNSVLDCDAMPVILRDRTTQLCMCFAKQSSKTFSFSLVGRTFPLRTVRLQRERAVENLLFRSNSNRLDPHALWNGSKRLKEPNEILQMSTTQNVGAGFSVCLSAWRMGKRKGKEVAKAFAAHAHAHMMHVLSRKRNLSHLQRTK